MKAVRFDNYGGLDVLRIAEVERPEPGAHQVLVQVKAAGINPGEAKIRNGDLHAMWPATFPSGEGSDLAGIVAAIGEGVEGFQVGDEVFGFTNKRGSHAEFVLVEDDELLAKPADVPWTVAGSLFVAGTTAVAAVRAVDLEQGDVVVVSGAAGGVGSIVVQLAVAAGATVIGLASPGNHAWLKELGVIPVAYGEGVADRIKAEGTPVAFLDNFGGGYVDLALDLGIAKERINTIIDFAAAAKHGVKAEGNEAAATTGTLAELITLIQKGLLQITVAATYPLTEVREAFRELERGHTHGKIVLEP
ncbi:NADPH:quinone reductase [Amycolatopsis xylanica]|uniref:NADPH:quinone reductase n=1 Tax=Amycolatopsis xylanica TaxID=589385 RepID=A0A1H3JSX9_9PSEU|nr:NADP-dependent oxidoreductase [Amycolatopsis xylanica]SDY43001.1 NADPH:quinone reductase [Amycolatopsis xylanica]